MPFVTDYFFVEVISVNDDRNALVFLLLALRGLVAISEAETSSGATHTERWQHKREEQRVIICWVFFVLQSCIFED